MRVSLNTIKQYTTVDAQVDELVTKINGQLGGVEQVIDFGKRFEGAVIAQITKCEKHPDADKLSVCEIDAGQDAPIQVVCGAPNVTEGLFVVWLPPGSTVPATADDKEPFVLAEKELRGVMSHGMLASPKELGLGDSHDGILEIDPNEWKPNDHPIEPGASFATLYGLDDTVIDIENKMFTHRPDLFGQLGVARELAGIQGKPFTSPAWYKDFPEFNRGESLELTVQNDASAAVPRFMSVAIKDVSVRPSPVWLQCELVRLGGKPINNIVDVTNYVMLLTAQPTHAYDYDKLRGHMLGARMAVAGETVPLLNGKTYELDASDVVIVDGEGPVGLAGIMGGGNSEVSSETKNLVLECANFDMYTVRKSSMRHGLFTDALTRFNKGQSPLQNDRVLQLLIMSIRDVAGGEVASEIFDKGSDKTQPAVSTNPGFINQRLGLSLDATTISTLLSNVEFIVSGEEELTITPPFWRTDIGQPEDIVEEVGRLYGFDKLPRVLPGRTTKPASLNDRLETKQVVRDALQRAGANEVLTYSFVNEKTMQRAEQDAAQAFGLSNALSPDLQYYRLSVLPSLLEKVHPNIKAGHDEFVLYEIGKGHNKNDPTDDEGLPAEREFVDLVYARKKADSGAAFYHIRRVVEQLVADLGLGVIRLSPLNETSNDPALVLFEQSRTARVETSNGQYLGVVGELKDSVIRNFKLPEYSAAASLDLAGLITARNNRTQTYRPLSKYPKVSQDISLKVPSETSYGSVETCLKEAIPTTSSDNKLQIDISPVTIYKPESNDSQTMTFHIVVTSDERTLTEQDVTTLLDTLAARAAEAVRAERI